MARDNSRGGLLAVGFRPAIRPDGVKVTYVREPGIPSWAGPCLLSADCHRDKFCDKEPGGVVSGFRPVSCWVPVCRSPLSALH